MKRKPVVWYVDDLPENLDRFNSHHGGVFTVRTFAHVEDVMAALDASKPDALLCDIFFYESVEVAQRMEKSVSEKADELRKFGEEIGADRSDYQAGIGLIERVSERCHGQFPIYAYTSKGPYLLTNSGFDRIADAGAKWLFKGKFTPRTERFILTRDVEESRARNSFTMRAARLFWVSLFGSGILGGLVVWLLTEVIPKWIKE